jgi:hypothetical protein
MASFDQLRNGFGVVTVMNAKIYKLKEGYSYTGATSALTPSNFEYANLYLDTLKITNLTMEGPTKTVTGGQYSNPLIKYGKTMTMEAQDALGRFETLNRFFGCEEINGVVHVTDKFPGAFAIEGDTFFIDQETGDQVPVYIFIPQFLPDGLFNLTQDAEGDATVFDLNGSVSVTNVDDGNGAKKVFYQIRSESFFGTDTALAGVKVEAVGTYREYCRAIGVTPNDDKIKAINEATSEALVKTKLKEAMDAVEIPSNT